MKQTNQLFSVLLILTLLVGCKKTTNNSECPENNTVVYSDDCVPFPDPPEFALEWPIEVPGEMRYISVDVNPEFDQEICLLERTGNFTQVIQIYNRETEELITLAEGQFDETVLWMAGDWIVYNDLTTETLRRVKKDGSEYQDMFSSDGAPPLRNHDHTQVLCQYEYTTYVFENTTVIDSVDQATSFRADWSHPDGKLIFPGTDVIGILNDLYSSPELVPVDAHGSIYDVTWCDNFSHILWVDQDGWYKTNPASGETVLIRENCQAKSYNFCAHIDQDVILRQVHRAPYMGDTLITTGKVGLIKCDGSSIELFDIPQ